MTITSERLFHAFLTDVLANNTLTVYMDGDFTVTAYVFMCTRRSDDDVTSLIFPPSPFADGEWTVSEHLQQAVAMTGMQTMELNILAMTYVDSSVDVLTLNFQFSLLNPSEFSSTWPLVTYNEDVELVYEGVPIGNLTLNGLMFGEGLTTNWGVGSLVRTPENGELISNVLSLYLLGFDVPLRVVGQTKVPFSLGFLWFG